MGRCLCHAVQTRSQVSNFYFQSLITDTLCLPLLTWEDLGWYLRACNFPSALGTEQCYRVLIVMDREPETG